MYNTYHLRNLWPLLLLLLSLFSYDGDGSEQKQPKLIFHKTQHHFGNIAQGTAVSYMFIAVNKGNADLDFSKFSTDCNCSSATSTVTNVPPGEAIQIQVLFSSVGLLGPFTKTFTIHTNDPSQPEIDLILTGTIDKGIQAEPSVIDFGKVPYGTEADTKVQISYPLDQITEISHIEWPAETEVYFRKDSSMVPTGSTLFVKLKSGAARGSLNRLINVHFNNPAINVLSIPVRAMISSPIVIQPTSISLLRTPKNLRPEEKITLTIHGKDPIQITKLDYDQKLFDVMLQKTALSGHKITIKLKEIKEFKSTVSTITLYTTSKEEPKINIPVQIISLKSKNL